MSKRAKANPTIPVRSKLEMLEKRRLLSTTLTIDATTIASTGDLSTISQPATAGSNSSTVATTTDPLGTNSAASATTDPIAPISFEEVVTVTDPLAVVDPSAPIEPVVFVDPTLPTDPSATPTDPTAATDPTTDPATDPTVLPITDPVTTIDLSVTTDPTAPTDPTAATDPTTPTDPTVLPDPSTSITLVTTVDPTVDPTAPTDPLASSDPVTTPDPVSTIDPTSPVTPVLPTDPSTDPTTPVSTPIDTPVVPVSVVDQTDLGDSTPSAAPTPTTPAPVAPTDSTPVASTPGSDSDGSTIASAAPVASTPVISQPTDNPAIDTEPVFMHVSLPPMLGGSHDGVSGFHPVYVPVASSTPSSGDVSSTAQKSSTASALDTSSAQTQTHVSVHDNLVSAATSAALQTAFSSTLIPGQPAAPLAPPVAEAAPAIEADPAAVVVDHSMDVTGPREEVAAQLAEEHLKLTRLVWTFPTIGNSQQVTEAAVPQPQAQTASAKVAPTAVAAATDGPAVIQLVQEIDVAPNDVATQAVAQAASKAGPRVVEIPVVRAGMTSSLNDSTGRSRNIMFAVVAGVASLAVQSYRSSRRKLAAAARAAHLDPLAAWLDDPEFDRRH